VPALPWTTTSTPDPTHTYTAFATTLPLTGHRHVPGFLRDTWRLRRQLRTAPGLIGYGLVADLRRATFRTISVWEDDASLRAFAGAEPHRSIMRRIPQRMGTVELRRFEVAGSDVPLTWRGVEDRVP
jgi:heme-degrading monooxygenase HmoA